MLSEIGRKVRTVEEAQSFILAFMYETLYNPIEGGYGKSYGFDLFLPWMMSWVLNVPIDKHSDEDLTPTNVLEVLYMDAAWDLVMKGLLRPGTRGTDAVGTGGDYGKGYSMTPKGRDWLKDYADQAKLAPKPEGNPAKTDPSVAMPSPEPVNVDTIGAEY